MNLRERWSQWSRLAPGTAATEPLGAAPPASPDTLPPAGPSGAGTPAAAPGGSASQAGGAAASGAPAAPLGHAASATGAPAYVELKGELYRRLLERIDLDALRAIDRARWPWTSSTR